MKVGDLVEQRYETGQYGPNAIGIVIDVDGACITMKWCDDGTTAWVGVEDLEVVNESR